MRCRSPSARNGPAGPSRSVPHLRASVLRRLAFSNWRQAVRRVADWTPTDTGASKSKKVADQIAEILVVAGVKRIYGVVGDSLNGITDSLRRQGKIDWVHMRHEEAGAFAAGAEAHLTGKLAACAGSCGPGNLHLINGLFDCHRSAVPVLAIAAHIPTSEIGSGYFQKKPPEILFRERR